MSTMTDSDRQFLRRDYRLTGPEAVIAQERGLVSGDWYQSPVPRKRMKELMQRDDSLAIRDTVIWLGLLIATGWMAHLLWGSWWSVPVFVIYGVLYGTVGDSRWHEGGHGTAFKTSWMNTAVYHLGSFMMTREPVSWRWSHARHHSDTIIVGRDPEIAVPRPTPIWRLLLLFTGIPQVIAEFRKLIPNCFGRLTAEEADYLPVSERNKAILAARIHVLIWVASITASIVMGSVEPLMLVGLPTLYGRWLATVYGLTQHAGLAEDVLDHRLGARTVTMNRLNRFLYWNMNFHVEHHMFPTVAFHALPALHEEVRADMPAPYHGLVDAYREIIPALFRQASDPTYFVHRPVPPMTLTS